MGEKGSNRIALRIIEKEKVCFQQPIQEKDRRCDCTQLVGDAAAGETAALLRELDRTCRTVRLLGVYTK